MSEKSYKIQRCTEKDDGEPGWESWLSAKAPFEESDQLARILEENHFPVSYKDVNYRDGVKKFSRKTPIIRGTMVEVTAALKFLWDSEVKHWENEYDGYIYYGVGTEKEFVAKLHAYTQKENMITKPIEINSESSDEEIRQEDA